MSNESARHWDQVYRTKPADAVSWYRPHLDRSIELIEQVAPDPSASVIDVGGGESTLVDDLLGKGYRSMSVLDISPVAIEFARKRVGVLARHVTWLRPACAWEWSPRASCAARSPPQMSA